MRDLFEKLKRDGVIPPDMTFNEFVNSYNTKDKVADLHAELTTMPELLTEESKDFNNFLGKYFGVSLPTSEAEFDDTKIDPIQNIYEGIDLSVTDDGSGQTLTQKADDKLMQDIESAYLKKKKVLQEGNAPNKTYLLKELDREYDEQKKQLANVSYTNNLMASLPNYAGSNTWNPQQSFKYKQNTKELNVLNPLSAVETEEQVVSQSRSQLNKSST